MKRLSVVHRVVPTKVGIEGKLPSNAILVQGACGLNVSDNEVAFLTIDDKCDLILEYTRQSVKGSGWDLNDVDGVTWFIGNFTDAMVKSGTIDDYDAMFVKCFKKYFNL